VVGLRRRAWRFACGLAGSLCASLLALLCLEAASRLVGWRCPAIGGGQGDRGLWDYDASKGWYHRPHSTGRSYLGGPDRGTIRINAIGLRGPEVFHRKPPGVGRVLVLGDSFVFGVGVDEAHLLTTHLGHLLRDSTSQPWEVINMAVSGYSTDQQLILLEELGLGLSPDLVVLVACDNDFEENVSGFVYHKYYKPYFQLGSEGRLRRRNDPVPQLCRAERVRLWLARRSNLWNAARTRRPSHPWAAGFIQLFAVRPPLRSGEDPVRLTARLVRVLRDSSERAGARFCVFNTGHRGERTPLFHRLRPHLRRDRIRFLGLEEELQRARQADPAGRWDFPQDTHWNIDAHRRAAEVVHGYLRVTGLLTPAQSQAARQE
jgi:hypothetical protein